MQHDRKGRRRLKVGKGSIEILENRVMLAAYIVGSATAYSTIQAAVNAASVGATITVDPGTYAEQVTVSKSLTIDGAQAGIDAQSSTRHSGLTAGESIVSGAVSSGTHSSAFLIKANDVTIDGFTVQGETSQNSQTGAGIVIAPSHAGTRIINDVIQNNVSGLFLANNSSTDPAIIQHDYFAGNNNAGGNGGRGIYTDGTISGGNLTNVTIDSNTFINNRGSAGTTTFEAACSFEATKANEQSNIRITNNVMTGNGNAVLFFNTTTILIQGNQITGCLDPTSGVLRFEGNNHAVTILKNTVTNSASPAVAVDSKGVVGDSSGFAVNSNNFSGNNTSQSKRVSLVYNAGVYTGAFDARNNWWGSASGPSGDGPGTGDAVSAGQIDTSTGLVLTKGGTELFSPWSTSINGTVSVIPTAPTGLTAAAIAPTQVNLSWTDTAPSAESGFIILRGSSASNLTQIGSTPLGVTSYSDNAVTGGMTYTYAVEAMSIAGNSPSSNIATVTTPAATTASTTYLSDLSWVSATIGYASIGKDTSVGGNPITLRGVVYPKGIGTHAVSNIVYNLNGQYATFVSDVGVDDEENSKGTGSVDFQLIGDGKILFDSGVLTNKSAVVHVNVPVAGIKQLTLVANNGVSGSIDYDHADWAGAKLLSQPLVPTAPTAPAGLTAVANSTSQITLAWTSTSSNQSGFQIDRSTDDVAFNTIATNVAATATTYVDTALTAATTYYYRIRAINSIGSSANSAEAQAVTFAVNTNPVYLSDLTPTSATIGWGSIQTDKSVGGNPITLRGVVYTKGIGTHAVSNIVFALGGKYSTFTSDIGVDDEENAKGTGSVDFQVIGDGKILFDSGVLTNASAIVSININITGVQNLTLVATNGVANSIDYDHADWAGAQMV